MRLLLLGFSLGLALGSSVRAQDTWLTVASPVSAGLWGIAFGGGQFVAVGEGGTVISSPPAGMSWTRRDSGSSLWLLGTAYAQGLHVVVGDRGTILTSPDGTTWTPRASGTNQRLNGVAFGRDRWLAVGEAGTVCTSTDGVSWTARTIANAGWLRGVVFAGDRFVLCGQGRFDPGAAQPLFVTTDGTAFESTGTVFGPGDYEALATDGATLLLAGRDVLTAPAAFPLAWSPHFSGQITPGVSYFRGAAFFNNQAVAVGTKGVILHGHPLARFEGRAWTRTQTSSAIDLHAVAASPTALVAVGSGGALLVSAATPSAPSPFLVSTETTVTAVAGSSVQLVGDASGSAPLSFQWSFDGRPLAGATQATLALTDLQPAQSGRYTLTATNPVGSATSTPYHLVVTRPLAAFVAPVDPTFVSPLTVPPQAFAVQPDGKVIVSAPMTFHLPGGQPQRGLVRLNTDGSVDPSFPLAGGLGESDSVFRIQLQSDGKILLFGNISRIGGVTLAHPGSARLNPDGGIDASYIPPLAASAGQILLADGRSVVVSIHDNVATLERLTADGSKDVGYPPTTVTLAPPRGEVSSPYYSVVTSVLDAQGRPIVAASSYQQVGTGIFYRNESRILRLRTDGTLDPTYPMATLADPIDELVRVGDKFTYIATTKSGPLGSIAVIRIARFNADGSSDPTYPAVSFAAASGNPARARLLGDGSALLATGEGVARYDPNGLRDRDYAARLAFSNGYGGIRDLHVLADGRLLLSGSFTTINGAPIAYLARIAPDAQASATRLTNLSVRQSAGTGSQTLIVGFVVAGQGGKTLLLRGIGPTLAVFGVGHPLADPRLTLVDSGGAVRLDNDNWGDSGDAPAISAAGASVGAFSLPTGSKDAAALTTVPAGAFTLQLGSATPGGVALAEGYDTGGAPTNASAARVVNFSARATAGSAEGTLIAGFTISGPKTKRVLLRAVGPSLAAFGVEATMPDPRLTLYSGSIAIASNDNWQGAAELSAAFTAVGAFSFARPESRDAALLLTLPAGGYTVQVNGVTDTAGVALIEVYELP